MMLGWSKEYDGQGKAIAGSAALEDNMDIVIDANSNKIPLKNIIFDRGRFFDGDGKVHIQNDGVYVICAQNTFTYTDNATKQGTAWISISKNGKETIGQGTVCPNLESMGIVPTVTVICELKKGDYLELEGGAVYLPSKTVKLQSVSTYLSIARLGD